MSKWISEFMPIRSGNYLIKTVVVLNFRELDPTYIRYNYNSNNGSWTNRDGWRVSVLNGANFKMFWWDEFGITENKIVKKLKF